MPFMIVSCQRISFVKQWLKCKNIKNNEYIKENVRMAQIFNLNGLISRVKYN